MAEDKSKKKDAKPAVKKKNLKVPANGIAHILASFNNTVVTIADQLGNVIAWSTAGHM